MGKSKKTKSVGNEASTPQTKSTSLPGLTHKRLCRETILGSDIFVARNALSPKECHQLVLYAESVGFQHQGSRGAAHQEALRDNDRISLNDANFAEHLWRRCGICDLFSDIQFRGRHAVGLNPHIRFYRYSKGQRFGKHIDESVSVDDGETLYTLLIYLSGCGMPHSFKHVFPDAVLSAEPLVGGETVFYGRKNRVIANIEPEMGKALLHVHGGQCHEHEGAQVKSGLKYILRSDVIFTR